MTDSAALLVFAFLFSWDLITFLFVLSFNLFKELRDSESRLNVFVKHVHKNLHQPIPIELVEMVDLLLQYLKFKRAFFIVVAVLTAFE